MSRNIASPLHDERVNTPFLRSIGCLALAQFELQGLRPNGVVSEQDQSWVDFADHLLAAGRGIMEGACASTFAGNTISILRDGVRIPVDTDHLDKLTTKIRRHIQVGRAVGIHEHGTDAAEFDLAR